MLYAFVERKNVFLGYKIEKFQKWKNWDFCKGVSMVFHGFGPKLAIFSSFYLGEENVFYNILERKIAFVGYKNERFKKSKKWYFLRGVSPWFWSKIGHFSNILF